MRTIRTSALGAVCATLLMVALSVQVSAAGPLTLGLAAQPTFAESMVPFTIAPTVTFSPRTATPGFGENSMSAQLADWSGVPIFNPATAQLSMSGQGPCLNNKCTIRVGPGSSSKAFPGLNINKLGAYHLSFTLEDGWDDKAAAAVVTNPIWVLTGPPSQLKLKSLIGGLRPVAQASPLVVELDDAGGNPILTDSTHSVYLQLLDPVTMFPSTKGAVLKGVTTVTLSQGVATFPGLSLDQMGDYYLKATAAGLPAVPPIVIGSAKFSAAADAADSPIFVRDKQIVVTSSPSSGHVGRPLDPLGIQLVDSNGALINTNEAVVIHLVQNGYDAPISSGDVIYPGTLTVPLEGGRATVNGLTVPATSGPGIYAFAVEMAGALRGISANRRAQLGLGGDTAPGAGPQFVVSDRQLVFHTQPGMADAGIPLDRIPVVDLADVSGALVGNSTDTVTISLPSGALAKFSGTGCALDGQSCTMALSFSRAGFGGLTLDTAGTYTLTATTSAVDTVGNRVPGATSAIFTVSAAAPAEAATSAPPDAPSDLGAARDASSLEAPPIESP